MKIFTHSSKFLSKAIIMVMLFALGGASEVLAQCGVCTAPFVCYKMSLSGGGTPLEVSWQMFDDLGNLVASGSGSQSAQYACLPGGCYTFVMNDTGGDGWDGTGFAMTDLTNGQTAASATLLGGFTDTTLFSIGGVSCYPQNCNDPMTLDITSGTSAAEITWQLIDNFTNTVVQSGFAPSSIPFCPDSACYTLIMLDSQGNGWNGATWTLTDSINGGGGQLGTGTLLTGFFGTVDFGLGGASCLPPPPITASDCVDAINVCNNLTFEIDPNGIGLNEIPNLNGTFSNPNSTPSGQNTGCLLQGEINSTWFLVNVWGSGALEFTFGGLGTQNGFYDWIMYPYTSTTCTDIVNNAVAPVRCNWNQSTSGGTGLAATTPGGGNPGNYQPPLNVVAGEQYVICFTNWSSAVNLVPLEFGGSAIISCDPLVLPIEFVNVSATAKDNGVLVEWTTTSEDFVDHFTVQVSHDLIEWNDLKELPGGGTDIGLINYEFVDAEPISGWNYYRIKQTDIDGIYEFSEHASALWEKEEEASIYPNPNKGEFTLEIGSSVDISAIRVVDAVGRDIPVTITSVNGVQQLSMDRPTSGIYYILIGSGETPALKVIVEKE